MPEFDKIEGITENLKDYVNTNYELIKLQATERTSVIGSGIISALIIVIIGLLFFFALSLGVSFYLSALIGDTFSGFLIVAGFYLLIALIWFIGRKKLIETPLREKIIQKLLEKNEK